jgi:hypothetical protein
MDLQLELLECARDDLFSRDLTRIATAMRALARAYQLLVNEGMAFKQPLADMEALRTRMAKRTLKRLCREYLSYGPQEAEAGRVLEELIREGYWTLEEYYQAVDEYMAEKREAAGR